MKKSKIIKSAIIVVLIVLVLASYYLHQINIINNIDQKVHSMNGGTFRYGIENLNNEEFLENMTDGGGGLVGYFRGSELIKMVERVGLSYGTQNFQFYYENEKLIFAYHEHRFFNHNEDGSKDYDHPGFLLATKYYFKDGKLFKKEFHREKNFPTGYDITIEFLLAQSERNSKIISEFKNKEYYGEWMVYKSMSPQNMVTFEEEPLTKEQINEFSNSKIILEKEKAILSGNICNNPEYVKVEETPFDYFLNNYKVVINEETGSTTALDKKSLGINSEFSDIVEIKCNNDYYTLLITNSKESLLEYKNTFFFLTKN
ncbi:MAG: hypothetical protein WC795_00535 [Candidatus Paceibacterota bacterium]|jgi:hypothetical protein